jgi:hypothetical protein
MSLWFRSWIAQPISKLYHPSDLAHRESYPTDPARFDSTKNLQPFPASAPFRLYVRPTLPSPRGAGDLVCRLASCQRKHEPAQTRRIPSDSHQFHVAGSTRKVVPRINNLRRFFRPFLKKYLRNGAVNFF